MWFKFNTLAYLIIEYNNVVIDVSAIVSLASQILNNLQYFHLQNERDKHYSHCKPQ